MKIKAILKIFTTALICFSFKAYGASVQIADTLIPRGEIYKIPVYCDLDATDINSLEIVFKTNPFVLDIKKIDATNSEIAPKSEFSASAKLDNGNYEYSVIASQFKKNTSKGKLFDLYIEALAGADTVCDFSTVSLKINGVEKQAEFKNAKIRTSGEPIYQSNPEGLYVNFPNPFRGSTCFPFNIGEESVVNFKLYDYIGNLVFDNKNIKKYMKIYNVEGSTIVGEVYNWDLPLGKGKYYAQFIPLEEKFSSAPYIMILETKKGEYSRCFMYVK
jgi:hypothetical protein